MKYYIVQNYEEKDGKVYDCTTRVFSTWSDARMRQIDLAIMCFEENFPRMGTEGTSLFALRDFIRRHTDGSVFTYISDDGHLYRISVVEDFEV